MAIGAMLRDGGGVNLAAGARRALGARYGASEAGAFSAAMVLERARAWRQLGAIPLPGRGELAMPVAGVVGGCGYFGCPRPGHLHAGLDLVAPAGTPVRAAEGGTIALVELPGQSGGYGGFVCVQHRTHLATCYAHLGAFSEDLRVGHAVMRGQVIGLVGSTGRSTGPHLHFEVRRGAASCAGCAVDPSPYLSDEVPQTVLPRFLAVPPEPEEEDDKDKTTKRQGSKADLATAKPGTHSEKLAVPPADVSAPTTATRSPAWKLAPKPAPLAKPQEPNGRMYQPPAMPAPLAEDEEPLDASGKPVSAPPPEDGAHGGP